MHSQDGLWGENEAELTIRRGKLGGVPCCGSDGADSAGRVDWMTESNKIDVEEFSSPWKLEVWGRFQILEGFAGASKTGDLQ